MHYYCYTYAGWRLSVSLEGRKKFHNKRPFFVAFDASGEGGAATAYVSLFGDMDCCSRSPPTRCHLSLSLGFKCIH